MSKNICRGIQEFFYAVIMGFSIDTFTMKSSTDSIFPRYEELFGVFFSEMRCVDLCVRRSLNLKYFPKVSSSDLFGTCHQIEFPRLHFQSSSIFLRTTWILPPRVKWGMNLPFQFWIRIVSICRRHNFAASIINESLN